MRSRKAIRKRRRKVRSKRRSISRRRFRAEGGTRATDGLRRPDMLFPPSKEEIDKRLYGNERPEGDEPTTWLVGDALESSRKSKVT